MQKNEVHKLINILKNTYPEATCSLNFKTPFELVVAVMLSAQCTDERVNKTTPVLFSKYNTVEAFVNIEISELENLIRPCGFYKNKAKHIKNCALQIMQNFNGIVPNNMEDLLNLDGIGRKSANVILLEVYGIADGIAVDTHCKRISNRIGLSSQKDPNKIEQDLLKQFDKSFLKDVNHLFVWHGRYTCIARKPKCNNCTINSYCKYYKNMIK